ncbi:hypothetical protein [Streptomyces lunaelactis]|uniref:hypothetical protein n=1 Tax=Streptomyces lunaelactis TaxID=1535768 RepID=UPI0015857696|nr:hypothetical protein [Streptomyces lunaelactis]NUK24389.1 hypothetical protein [Streptomyces lunaelactis]NUK60319.1 hypothetical protein [Streptomyces lunaelactis]
MTRASLRRLAVTLSAISVVSGLGLGPAGLAQASPRPTTVAPAQHVLSAPVRAAATRSPALYYHDDYNFPTWVFGKTRLCVTAGYSAPGTARVQSRAPLAAPEYVSVGAGQTRCVERWWGGFPVNAMNITYSRLTVTAS